MRDSDFGMCSIAGVLLFRHRGFVGLHSDRTPTKDYGCKQAYSTYQYYSTNRLHGTFFPGYVGGQAFSKYLINVVIILFIVISITSFLKHVVFIASR